MTPNRADAWHLLNDYTKSESLLKHALAVEAAVRGYARTFGEDEDAWGIVALLHDFDYERWPSLEEHPYRGSEILREKGYPEWMIRAILSHAVEVTGVARESRLKRVDLPAFGKPIKPTSAITLSSSTIQRSSPGVPGSTWRGA